MAVPSASVSIDWGGVVNGSSNGTTDSLGYFILTSGKGQDSGTPTATVTSVTKDGFTLDSANSQMSANVATPGDISTGGGNGKGNNK